MLRWGQGDHILPLVKQVGILGAATGKAMVAGEGVGPCQTGHTGLDRGQGLRLQCRGPSHPHWAPRIRALISLSPLLPARCICWVLIGFRGVSSEDQGEGGGLGRMGEGLPLCCCPQLSTHLWQDGNPAPSHTQHQEATHLSRIPPHSTLPAGAGAHTCPLLVSLSTPSHPGCPVPRLCQYFGRT